MGIDSTLSGSPMIEEEILFVVSDYPEPLEPWYMVEVVYNRLRYIHNSERSKEEIGEVLEGMMG